MKPEDHVKFLYELISITDELQTLVEDYCRKITPEDEDISEFSPHDSQREILF